MSVYLGTNKVEPRAGLGSLSIVDTVDTNGGTIRSITNLLNSIDLSWLVASTPTPSVRNFFYALANNTFQHGEFTLASTPTNAFTTLFTTTNFGENNAPQGIIFIDKDFYQNSSTLPHQSSQAISITWLDKAFLNPTREASLNSEYPMYGSLTWSITQTYNSEGGGGGGNTFAFDGTTCKLRGYWLFDNNSLTWKSQYGGYQYTTFVAGRTYIWLVY